MFEPSALYLFVKRTLEFLFNKSSFQSSSTRDASETKLDRCYFVFLLHRTVLNSMIREANRVRSANWSNYSSMKCERLLSRKTYSGRLSKECCMCGDHTRYLIL